MNPYASPTAPAPLGEPGADNPPPRPAIEPLLFGLVIATFATAAAHYGLLPLVAAMEYAAFGYWDFPPAPLEVVAAGAASMVFWTLLGAPALLLAWGWRRVTPRAVLVVGGGVSLAVWFVSVALVVGSYTALFVPGANVGAELAGVAYLAASLALYLAAPLFAGFVALAWWVRRNTAREQREVTAIRA
ncbi:MAG: hypothetical protein AAGB00_06065 [Planctomycetota bacterium]